MRRVQGTPSDVLRCGDLFGYETWQYGLSTELIHTRIRQVVEWQNHGNLKAKMVLGNQVTSSEMYTVGSPKDDVIRLQSTPSGVFRHGDLLGSETCQYGLSTVLIDTCTRREIEWQKHGNLKGR